MFTLKNLTTLTFFTFFTFSAFSLSAPLQARKEAGVDVQNRGPPWARAEGAVDVQTHGALWARNVEVRALLFILFVCTCMVPDQLG